MMLEGFPSQAFSLRLMRVLKLRGLTLGGACIRAGIERGGKYSWLNGRAPRADLAVRLSHVLGCSPGWLLFGDPQQSVIASDRDLRELAHSCGHHLPDLPGPGRPLQWTGPVP